MFLFSEFKDVWTKLAILSLIVLLLVEWLAEYDTLQRQIALSTTNLFVLIGYFLVYKRLKNRHRIILPSYIAWLIAFSVWLDAAGNFAHFYTQYFWYDDLTHFEGSLALATAIFYIFYYLNQQGYFKLNRWHLGLYTLTAAMFLVSIYEITELAGDLLFATYRITTRFDTASDFFYNLLGALIVVLIGSWVIRKKEKGKVVN